MADRNTGTERGRDRRSIWFVYRRTGNEYSATPANATGWFVLIGCILATGVLALGSSLLVVLLWPWAMSVTLPAAIVGGVRWTLWITKRHGREIR